MLGLFNLETRVKAASSNDDFFIPTDRTNMKLNQKPLSTIKFVAKARQNSIYNQNILPN